MTKEKMQGLLLTMIGMLFIVLAMYLGRSDIQMTDFGLGLMNGAGIGFLLLALLRYGNKSKRTKSTW